MSYRHIVYMVSMLLVTLSLVGCSGSGSNDSTTQSNESSIDISLSALYTGTTSSSSAALNQAPSFLASAPSKIVTGELLAVNHTTGTSETYDWSVYLDESDLSATSNKTIVLEPGDYTFSLLLTDANMQYGGTAVYQVLDQGQHSIPLTVAPIIGDTVVNVSVLSELATYKFSYATSELTSLTAPKVGISIDGGSEQLFTINKATGLSQTYLNLTDGSYNAHLSFYDGNIQVGRSVPEQENITVVAGDPLNIDIVALHGEAEFILDVADGNATIRANIAQEIIDEIGLDNLEVILTLSDGNTTKEALMTLVTDTNSTYATTTLSGLQFGTYALQLKFNDKTDTSVPVGSCLADDVVLNSVGSTVECKITLQKRSVFGGNLLATVGINVFNTSYEPIAGASVYANDVFIGLTNEGTFGTKGYLKTYQVAGDITFSADDTNKTGSVSTTLNPLDVKNFDIFLDQDIQADINMSAYAASGYGKPWKYDLNATGDALTWEDTNASLPLPLNGSQTAVIGDYVYLFGGHNNSVDILRAPISDPTAWVDTGADLPTFIYNSQTVLIGNYVYLFGGSPVSGSNNSTNIILRAPLADPTSWVDTGLTLPSNISHSQVAVIGDYVYLFGPSSIYKAPITNPMNWIDTGVTLPSPLGYSQLAVIGDYVYLFGGFDGGLRNYIYKAPITDPTSWVDTGATLPIAIDASQLAVIGDYVYLFGGYIWRASTNIIYRAPVSDPTSWIDSGSKLPTGLYYSQVATIGDYVYLFSGTLTLTETTSDKIYRSYIGN